MGSDDTFDPYAILGALERNRVLYVLIGGLARVIRGTDELTSDVDICPQTQPGNLRRLDRALAELNAFPRDSDDALVREYTTDAGGLSVIEEPTGIARGYDGLRRQTDREPLGQALRIQVAGIPDLLRNLEHLGRELDTSLAEQLRTMVDLERSLGRGRSRGIGR